jgi:hypothetical protein
MDRGCVYENQTLVAYIIFERDLMDIVSYENWRTLLNFIVQGLAFMADSGCNWLRIL